MNPAEPSRLKLRRGGRVVEGARLESVYTGNRIVGSNPTPSATPSERNWHPNFSVGIAAHGAAYSCEFDVHVTTNCGG
jgi:hypothetical protein